jgi:predicted component of type VI protein secretion system
MNFSRIHTSREDDDLIPEQFKISAQNLFLMSTRSSEGLRIMLSSFFGVRVRIEQFVGRFVEADRSEQTSLGRVGGRFNQLGFDCCLGNKIWDSADGIDIIIGPLSFEKYISFLPKNNKLDQRASKLQKAKEIVRSYIPCGINATLIFCLDSCFVRETILNSGKRLNKDSFVVGEHRRGLSSFREEV